MPRIRVLAISLGFALVLILSAFFVVLRVSIRPESLRDNVVSGIQTVTEAKLNYQSFDVSYFPWIEARMKSPELVFKNGTEKKLRADLLKIRLSPFAALMGRADIHRITVEKGEAKVPISKKSYLKVLDIHDINLSLTSVKLNRPIKIQMKGALGGISDAISLQGQFSVAQWEKWDWQAFSVDAHLNLKNCPMVELVKQLDPSFPALAQKGALNGHIHVHKSATEKQLRVEGESAVQNFVYQAQSESNTRSSPEINAKIETDFAWNPESEAIDMKYMSLSSPLGKLETQGRILFGTREVQEVRIMASDIALESLSQYNLFFKEAIPFNFGFSGKSNSEISINGTLDHLSIHGSWDLTPMLFAYGRFFSKPKDVPANLIFDLLLKDLKTINGDFSLKLKEVMLKGTFSDLDCETGIGELNVITNKFSIEGWEAYLPPFEKAHLNGDVKILGNFKGNLQMPEQTEKMFNVTFQDVSLLNDNSEGIKHLSFQIDASPVAIYFKDAQFELNKSKVAGGFTVFQPGPSAHLQGKINSEHLEPFDFLRSFRAFMKDWFSEDTRQNLLKAQEYAGFFFPEGAGVDDLTADIEQKDQEWTLSSTQFELYGGSAKLRGGYKPAAKPTSFWGHFDLDHVNLGKFLDFKTQKGQAKIAEGIFFLTGDFSGENLEASDWWKNRLTGQGSFSMTNGIFSTIDLMEGIASIDELAAMRSFTSGNTSFDDLHADFSLKDGRVSTENLVMVSQNISAKGNGELSLEGLLNYRLEAFLASPLAGKITDPLLGSSDVSSQDKLLGPIPFLLSGPFDKPELKTDPSRLPELRDNLLKGSAQKVLRNFLPEDFFFKRRDNS